MCKMRICFSLKPVIRVKGLNKCGDRAGNGKTMIFYNILKLYVCKAIASSFSNLFNKLNQPHS